jgi:hypothetical protein
MPPGPRFCLSPSDLGPSAFCIRLSTFRILLVGLRKILFHAKRHTNL